MRLEVGLPGDLRRYVFARVNDRLGQLARSIDVPDVQLKLGGTEGEMRSQVGAGWALTTTSKMMVCDADGFGDCVVPAGYRDCVVQLGDVTVVEIVAEDGLVAASGRAAEYAGVFVYDHIVTDGGHRRRGLGRCVMGRLSQARRSMASRQILTATPDGLLLYASLGWQVYSPWITAVRPA